MVLKASGVDAPSYPHSPTMFTIVPYTFVSRLARLADGPLNIVVAIKPVLAGSLDGMPSVTATSSGPMDSRPGVLSAHASDA